MGPSETQDRVTAHAHDRRCLGLSEFEGGGSLDPLLIWSHSEAEDMEEGRRKRGSLAPTRK